MSESKTENLTISFSADDFFKYKEVNNVMPKTLIPFCTDREGILTIRESVLKETKTVLNSFLSGLDPNDNVFLNNIRQYLNIISQKNYDQYLASLKKLNYTNKTHFDALAKELIIKSMLDQFAVKGVDLPAGHMSPSEIYANVASEFSTFFIKDGEMEVKFNLVLLSLCQQYFTDFTNPAKPLDQNNQYRVDHYKGFMNFLGLLFNRGILSHKITIGCLTTIRDLIFKNDLTSIECENIYDGYQKMLRQILAVLEKGDMKRMTLDKSYLTNLLKIHNDIKENNEKQNKIRKFTMLVHRDLEGRIEKILKS